MKIFKRKNKEIKVVKKENPIDYIKKEKNKHHYTLFYKGFRYDKGYDFVIQKNSCFFIEYEDILEGKIDLKIVTKEEYQAAFDEYFNIVQELIINDSDEFENNE